MATMRAIKSKDHPYSMVAKSVIMDKNLSAKAKGILVYILSRPDDWQVYESELVKNFKDGRDSIRSGLKELIDSGYMIRHKKRNDGKFMGYDYLTYEEPQINRSGKTDAEKPITEKPITENPTLLNNNITNKQKNEISYKQVYEHYLSLDLIKHRSLNDDMRKSMDKAMKTLNCDFNHLITLLDRHKKKVELSKETDFPIKVRPIHEFFGQKKYQSTFLICSDYDDGVWVEPKAEKKKVENQDRYSTEVPDWMKQGEQYGDAENSTS